MNSLKHIPILDPLRGLAALAVVLFHFTGSILPTLRPSPLEGPFDYGKWGVQVFFVISGFVIPHAMERSGYIWAGLGRFMTRRFIRIAPPAYAAALLMILFYYTAIFVNGRPVEGNEIPGLSLRSIVANITFLVPYMDTQWFNFVYWSLTVEFEFYLLLALLFPFIQAGSPSWRVALVLATIVVCSLVPGPVLFPYAGYFALGMVVFVWQRKDVDRWLLAVIVLLICALDIYRGNSTPIFISLVAALIIASGTSLRTGPPDWLGKVSYSLYITHVPAGYFAESVLKRVLSIHGTTNGKMLMLLVYVIIALLVAQLFYHVVERPFLHSSKRHARVQR